MRKYILIILLLLLSCSEREELKTKLQEFLPAEEPSLLTILSDPADSIIPLPGGIFIIKVEFSKPVDPSSLSGNILVHPVIGDTQDGENRMGDGVVLKNWSLSDDKKNLFISLSLQDGEYILHLKKEIKSIDGKNLDGICDFKDETSDAYSSGFSTGGEETFVTKAFCKANPFISYLGPVGGGMEFKDHSGCSGKVNLGFPTQLDFELRFSFPTGTTSNYFLSKEVGRNIEMIDLTTDERVPIYFSLDNRITWKDDIEKFEIENITNDFPVYIRPQNLSPLHRFAIKINRFEDLKDRYELPFSDEHPDEDMIYEVCFTTAGISSTLRVKEITIERKDGYISEMKITFLTPDPGSDKMDEETIIPQNFSIMNSKFESIPFKLELHREVIFMQEVDVVLLRIPEGYLGADEPFGLKISYRVSDERGNTLDGNEDGYIEENGNDDYLRIFQ